MARTVWTYIRNIILACSIVCFAGLSQLEIYYGVLGGENAFGAGQVAKICIGVAIVAGITGLVLIFRFQHLWTKLFQIPEWQFGLYMLLSVYACGLYTRHLTVSHKVYHLSRFILLTRIVNPEKFEHACQTRDIHRCHGGGTPDTTEI